MASCSSLDIDDRINIGYGSIVSALLSLVGSIGTILLIKIRNKNQKKKLLIQRKQQLSINNNSINGGGGGIVQSTSLSSLNLNIITQSFPSQSQSQSLSLSQQQQQQFQQILPPPPKTPTNNNGNSQKTKVSHFIINLSIANALDSIFLLVSKFMMIHFNSKYIENIPSTSNHSFNDMISLCTLSNGFVGFSFISTFFWTLAISMYIYQQFQSGGGSASGIGKSLSIINKSNKFVKIIFYLICWVIPFLLGLVIVAGSRLSTKSTMLLDDGLAWCLIDPNIQLISFYLPLIICLVFTIFYTILIRHKFSPHLNRINTSSIINNNLVNSAANNNNNNNNGSTVINSNTNNIGSTSVITTTSALIKLQSKIIERLVLFLIIFIVCWLPSIISFFISYFSKECKQFIWFEYIVSILQPLQGFLNFLSYTLFKNFKSILIKLKKKYYSLNHNNNNSNQKYNQSIFYTKGTNNNHPSKINNNNFYFTFSTFDFDNNQDQINN